ncbi:hypothetical protein Aros01_08131 [Streptosporangium roseum]|uniref:hypothetical protein n=1 Tax=Streptosporangium roseum TaxID=2001 RepID=UPI00309C8529
MRRYRFGRIATLIALGYLAVVAVLGAFALTTDRGDLLWKIVTRDSGMSWFLGPGEETLTVPWGLTVVLILIGALQAWALWQVLRGRARGELTHRGRKVGLLRLALYLSIGYSLISIASIPLIHAWKIYWVWSVTEIASGFVQLAIVWLFFLVLRGTVSHRLRLFSLIVGTIAVVSNLGQEITDLFDLHSAEQILTLAGGYGYVWLAWSVSILIAQAKDPRWSAATVRIGVIAQAISVLQPSGMVSFGGNGFPSILTVYTLLGAVSVFGLVWDARTAHELTAPLPQPDAGHVPVRPAARWWPLAAVAIALPLIPAAVNLAHGNGTLRPRAAKGGIGFSTGGTRPLVTIADGAATRLIGWDKPLPAPEVTGSKAIYRGTVADGDLVLEALPEGFSQQIVLHRRPERPGRLTMPLTLPKGVKYAQTAKGALRVTGPDGDAAATTVPTAR